MRACWSLGRVVAMRGGVRPRRGARASRGGWWSRTRAGNLRKPSKFAPDHAGGRIAQRGSPPSAGAAGRFRRGWVRRSRTPSTNFFVGELRHRSGSGTSVADLDGRRRDPLAFEPRGPGCAAGWVGVVLSAGEFDEAEPIGEAPAENAASAQSSSKTDGGRNARGPAQWGW